MVLSGSGADHCHMTQTQTQLPSAADHMPLRRPSSGRLVAGVAAGVADYLGLDVAVVRIAFVVLTIVGGLGIPAYLAGWLLIPDEEHGESNLVEWLEAHR
jgi:phage shock protein PspC (stress-responsive transcriptional regulator)